ncbi:uncharacterized protein [Pseudorca crassidens]|uniref:uncharacterized protein n=1 Tax=Pseudorca crassidens TaxID=82174 RepID=UPI00352D7CB4
MEGKLQFHSRLTLMERAFASSKVRNLKALSPRHSRNTKSKVRNPTCNRPPGHRRTGEIPWAVRVARQSPSRLTTGWSSPLLHPHPCSRSTPTHGPPASQRHRLAAGCKDAPPTEGEPEAGRATALGVPEPRESESSRTWGKAAGDSGHARGCRAAQARCWPHSRDQIRFSGLERVGCRGLSWLLGRRGEKGRAAEIPWSCSCHQISARCTVITIPLFSKKMHSGHPFNSRKLWYP